MDPSTQGWQPYPQYAPRPSVNGISIASLVAPRSVRRTLGLETAPPAEVPAQASTEGPGGESTTESGA